MTHKAQKKTTTATNKNLNPNLYQASTEMLEMCKG